MGCGGVLCIACNAIEVEDVGGEHPGGSKSVPKVSTLVHVTFRHQGLYYRDGPTWNKQRPMRALVLTRLEGDPCAIYASCFHQFPDTYSNLLKVGRGVMPWRERLYCR